MPWWERIKSVDWIPDRIQHQNWIPDSIQKGELPSKEELKEWHENLNLIPDEIQKPMEEASIALSNEIKRDVERLKNQNWIPDKEQSLGDWYEKLNLVPDEIQRPVQDAASNVYSALTGEWIGPAAKQKWNDGDYLGALGEGAIDAAEGSYRNIAHVLKGTYFDEQDVGKGIVRQPLPGEEPIYIFINPPGDGFKEHAGFPGHVGMAYKGKLISYSTHGYNGSIEQFNTNLARAYKVYPSTLNPPMDVEKMEKKIDELISATPKRKTFLGDKMKDEYNVATSNCATHVSKALNAGGVMFYSVGQSVTSRLLNKAKNIGNFSNGTFIEDAFTTAAPSDIEAWAIRGSSGNMGAKKAIEDYRRDLQKREVREATEVLAGGNEDIAIRLKKVDSQDQVPEDRRDAAYSCYAEDSKGYYYLRTKEEYMSDMRQAFDDLKKVGQGISDVAGKIADDEERRFNNFVNGVRSTIKKSADTDKDGEMEEFKDRSRVRNGLLARVRNNLRTGHKEQAELDALRNGRRLIEAQNVSSEASPAEKMREKRENRTAPQMSWNEVGWLYSGR